MMTEKENNTIAINKELYILSIGIFSVDRDHSKGER